MLRLTKMNKWVCSTGGIALPWLQSVWGTRRYYRVVPGISLLCLTVLSGISCSRSNSASSNPPPTPEQISKNQEARRQLKEQKMRE